MIYVVMGVSGCGKTTVGKLLANNKEIPFFDADDFHTEENVRKMQSGSPLTDKDREPWLNHLSEKMREWNENNGAVLACSALKKSYRDTLTTKTSDVIFIWLDGSFKLIQSRMQKREGHYMPPGLLQSQFDDLEPPTDSIRISIDQTPSFILNDILQKIE